MDITEFKKYALPNIEAGKMVDLIRTTIKEVQYSKQDEEEKQKESLKPIVEKLEEEAKEISDLRKALEPKPQLPALPATQDMPALELNTETDTYLSPAEEEEVRKNIFELDKKFSDEQLRILESQGIDNPEEIFYRSLKDDSVFKENRDKTVSNNIKLGKTKATLEKKIKETVDPDERKSMEEKVKNIEDNMKLNKDYRVQIDNMKKGKSLFKKKGGGAHIRDLQYLKRDQRVTKGSYTPLRKKSRGFKGDVVPLLDRLELLYGSIAAGNNSSKVKNEYSNIVHFLHKLNVINNDDVINLLRGIL